MSIHVLVDVWEFGPRDPTETLILLYLADGADDQGIIRLPSIAEIAPRARCYESAVSGYIAKLERDGWIYFQRGPKDFPFDRCVINVDRLADRARVGDHS